MSFVTFNLQSGKQPESLEVCTTYIRIASITVEPNRCDRVDGEDDGVPTAGPVSVNSFVVFRSWFGIIESAVTGTKPVCWIVDLTREDVTGS